MPLIAILWAYLPSQRAVLLMGVCGVDCSLRLPEWRSCTQSEGASKFLPVSDQMMAFDTGLKITERETPQDVRRVVRSTRL